MCSVFFYIWFVRCFQKRESLQLSLFFRLILVPNLGHHIKWMCADLFFYVTWLLLPSSHSFRLSHQLTNGKVTVKILYTSSKYRLVVISISSLSSSFTALVSSFFFCYQRFVGSVRLMLIGFLKVSVNRYFRCWPPWILSYKKTVSRLILNFSFELCIFCIQAVFFVCLCLNKSECAMVVCCYLGFLFDFCALFHFLSKQLITVCEYAENFFCVRIIFAVRFRWSHFKIEIIMWNMEIFCLYHTSLFTPFGAYLQFSNFKMRPLILQIKINDYENVWRFFCSHFIFKNNFRYSWIRFLLSRFNLFAV